MPNEHFIAGKDASLESSINRMQEKLALIGFHVDERCWLNPVDGIWSVQVSERVCPLLFTNGEGASKLAALAGALGEFFERLSCNYFWTHCYLGENFATHCFTHYPQEHLFKPGEDSEWPQNLLTLELQEFYNPGNIIPAHMLVEHNSGNVERGVCALPFIRQNDGMRIWFPVNIIGNLYVSNGMSAGNTQAEARTQALSEIVDVTSSSASSARGFVCRKFRMVLSLATRVSKPVSTRYALPALAFWSRMPLSEDSIRS